MQTHTHNNLTIEQLRDVLHYCPENGIFTWKKSFSNRVKIGMQAGNLHSSGYIVINTTGARYKAHRLAWFYVYGKWPEKTIDHINGIRHDNRISNLRDVTQRENLSNRTKPRKSGRLIGAAFHKATGKWSAQITQNYKKKHLGYFETEKEAHEAYQCARLANTALPNCG